METKWWGDEISWEMTPAGSDDPAAWNDQTYGSFKSYEQQVCLPPGTYTLKVGDAWGDGWHGGSLSAFLADGTELFAYTMGSGYYYTSTEVVITSTAATHHHKNAEAVTTHANATQPNGTKAHARASSAIMIPKEAQKWKWPDNEKRKQLVYKNFRHMEHPFKAPYGGRVQPARSKPPGA